MWKILKKFFLFMIISLIFIFSIVIIRGYLLYKSVTDNISIDDKIKEIKNNDYVKIDNISDDFLDAIIAVEDHRFYNHKGIDILSTIKAMFTNFHNKTIVAGGSSITQQLARNMYFTQEQKFQRKVAELFVASEIEKKLEKDEILELYVNTIYYGSGYYGVLEASKGYFNKSPSDLSLSEATMLAGLPNAPSVYSLDVNPDLAKQRQKQVVNAMVEYNYLDANKANSILEE